MAVGAVRVRSEIRVLEVVGEAHGVPQPDALTQPHTRGAPAGEGRVQLTDSGVQEVLPEHFGERASARHDRRRR